MPKIHKCTSTLLASFGYRNIDMRWCSYHKCYHHKSAFSKRKHQETGKEYFKSICRNADAEKARTQKRWRRKTNESETTSNLPR